MTEAKKKPRYTTHTIESLMARTEEYGDCRLWTGYLGNGVPMVFHDGVLMPVRRLIRTLEGKSTNRAFFYSCTCGEGRCVEGTHILERTGNKHMRLMAANSDLSPLKRAKLIVVNRTLKAKLSLDAARQIRASTERTAVLAERYGVSRYTICRVKRHEAWSENTFAGLMR